PAAAMPLSAGLGNLSLFPAFEVIIVVLAATAALAQAVFVAAIGGIVARVVFTHDGNLVSCRKVMYAREPRLQATIRLSARGVDGTVSEHAREDGQAAEEAVPRPAAERGRAVAEVAANGCAVRAQYGGFHSQAFVVGNVVARDSPTIQLHFHEVEGRRFHSLAVNRNAVE